MNSRHRRTLAAVFAHPTSSNIAWDDVEALLTAAGCRKIEGSGSRVKFENKGLIAAFHRPHPAKEAKKYQVEDARQFLEKIGVRP
jgi:hypothetical protein